jgi:hypothetical protein
MRTAQLLVTLVALSFSGVLAGAQTPTPAAHAPAIDELWIDPTDLEQRDLFRGPAMGPGAPDATTTFTFVKEDTSGRSPGYDVRDANGVVWSVKLGPEAQSEVLASRILWAIGFHQPPTYYVSNWTLTGGAKPGAQEGGRFRPQLATHKTAGDRWDFAKHPLARTRQMAGLLVAQMMLNNWDLKDSNNKVIEINGGEGGPRRLYMVRDLGASLGSNEQAKWVRWMGIRAAQGSKNDLEGFLESGFIDGVENGRVKFSYSGPNKPLVSNITVDDVRWTAQLMSRLTDQQWQDAFRAAGYTEADSARFIAKFKEKIAQGLALK